MANDTSDVYHEGELAVQRRAGVRDQAARLSGMVERTVPDGEDVCGLIAGQPHAVVTSVDRDGDVWVSFLTADPGFVRVADERTVRFETAPAAGDPLAEHLRPGMPTGALLVDPRSRNRLRLNGTATPLEGGPGFELAVAEAFPNCPKYIQRRSFDRVSETEPAERSVHDGLAPEHRAFVGETDTFFIGSHYPETGADASHRGGNPGFVDVDGDTVVYPDYPGNNMFCTLGNVEAHSRVGLLVVDFGDGRTLQLTGRAELVWDDSRVAAYEGAERLVEITVERTVELPDGNPLRWSLEERSPYIP
ncbi:MAG: pyridoxamine 5'-phosphate oxidase family protein [Halolamina sp.]